MAILALAKPILSFADTIKLNNGQVHKGLITSEEKGRVQLKLDSSGARIWFPRDQISSIEKTSKQEDSQEKEEPVEFSDTQGLDEDVIRARELLKKMREQPEKLTNKGKTDSNAEADLTDDSSSKAVSSTGASSAEIEKLIDKLRNGQFYDKLNACKKLGDLGAKEAIPHLIHYLDDENFTIRENSNRSLIKITGKDFGFNPADRRNVRLWAIDKWKEWYNEEKKKEADSLIKSLW